MLGRGSVERVGHFVQDVQAPFARLLQGLFDDLPLSAP